MLCTLCPRCSQDSDPLDHGCSSEIAERHRQLVVWHAQSEARRRLASISGLGIIAATAIAATVTDPEQFSSSRRFAAWLCPSGFSTSPPAHPPSIMPRRPECLPRSGAAQTRSVRCEPRLLRSKICPSVSIIPLIPAEGIFRDTVSINAG